MTYDNSLEAAVREYLAGATRALDRGDVGSASTEIVQALYYSFGVVRSRLDADSPGYLEVWSRVASELSKLPPSLVRQAVRLLDERSGPPWFGGRA